MRSKVDLPEPLRPTRQIRSPVATARPAPDNSGATPKVRVMSCSRSSGGMSQPFALCLAPNRREPGLPRSRQAWRAIVVVQLDETRRSHAVAPNLHRSRLAADIGFGRQMHKKHAGRAADRASAVAATADIVGEEHFTAVASVLLSVAGFDFKCAGKHDEQLTPRGWMPVLIEAFRHLRHHCALRRQKGGPADGIAESIGRRIVDRHIDLDKLRSAIGCRSKANDFHQGSPNSAKLGARLPIRLKSGGERPGSITIRERNRHGARRGETKSGLGGSAPRHRTPRPALSAPLEASGKFGRCGRKGRRRKAFRSWPRSLSDRAVGISEVRSYEMRPRRRAEVSDPFFGASRAAASLALYGMRPLLASRCILRRGPLGFGATGVWCPAEPGQTTAFAAVQPTGRWPGRPKLPPIAQG